MWLEEKIEATRQSPALTLPWLLSALMLTACGAAAGRHQIDGDSAAPEPPPTEADAEAAPAPNPTAPASEAAASSAAESDAAAAVMPDTEPDPSRSLPEVTVQNVGLHIGGADNSAAAKAPFQRAIEQKFEDFLGCYKKAAQPKKGGTFGVDLFIRREGGHPEVRQPRTGMQGEDFRRCMAQAFASVSFERPRAGPTVISYSVKFVVRDPTSPEP